MNNEEIRQKIFLQYNNFVSVSTVYKALKR